MHGLCRFLLRSTEPNFALYVTPIHLDPERPAMPISYPAVYSTYLAKRQGPFATLGLAEDTWALNEGVLDDQTFIQQCLDDDRERELMFFDCLDKVKRGLCACVFDGTDRIQHTFWRDTDRPVPSPSGRGQGEAMQPRSPLPPGEGRVRTMQPRSPLPPGEGRVRALLLKRPTACWKSFTCGWTPWWAAWWRSATASRAC